MASGYVNVHLCIKLLLSLIICIFIFSWVISAYYPRIDKKITVLCMFNDARYVYHTKKLFDARLYWVANNGSLQCPPLLIIQLK